MAHKRGCPKPGECRPLTVNEAAAVGLSANRRYDVLCFADGGVAIRRNLLFPTLPVAGPLVSRCARSGLPVAGVG